MAFIKLDRAMFENKMWFAEPFTKAQAWIDLIGMANFADKTKYYNGKFHKIKRGQIVTSQRTLADRWKWSKTKVRTYIQTLIEAEMLTADNTNRWTTLTVVNYAKYQDRQTAERPQNGPPKDHGKTAERPQKDLQEEYKEDKERKNIYTPTAKQTKTNASSVRVDYGGVWLTDAEWDELEAMVSDKEALLDIIDRAGEWLQNNPRPKNRHKGVVITFLRNDGLI